MNFNTFVGISKQTGVSLKFLIYNFEIINFFKYMPMFEHFFKSNSLSLAFYNIKLYGQKIKI